MKSKALFVLAGLVAASIVVASGKYPEYKKKTLYAANDLRGKQAPKLEVETWLKGEKPDTKGKVLVIDFWATWCGPCRELIPEMNAWKKKYGKDVVFMGISDESASTIRDFMKSTPMDYPVASDPKKQMSKKVGVQGIPHVLVVTPDGVVRWQGFPLSDEDKLTDEILEQIIKASKSK